jgi:hypothetical protein
MACSVFERQARHWDPEGKGLKLYLFGFFDTASVTLALRIVVVTIVGIIVIPILFPLIPIVGWWRRWVVIRIAPRRRFLTFRGVAPVATVTVALVVAMAIIIPIRLAPLLVGRPSFRRGRALAGTVGSGGMSGS